MSELLDALRRWWEFDHEDERVRRMDRAELLASLLSIFLMAAMFVWVHNQAAAIGRTARALAAEEQARLNAEAKLLASSYIAQVEACKRLQIIRIEDNRSHLSDFEIDKIFTAAILAPGARERAVTQGQGALFDRYKVVLHSQLAAKTWVPRTDCQRAVNEQGVRYRAPAPVAFTTAMPPKNALTLYPSDLS